MAITPPGGSEPPGGGDLDGLEATIRSWRELGARYGRILGEGAPGETPEERARRLQLLLELGELREAQTLVASWLLEWLEQLPERGEPEQLAQVELWHCLADVVERTNDQALLELFWQGIERIRPPLVTPGVLPLLGVPLLNRVDLLAELLASLDVPVGTLALVDHSGGRQDQGSRLLRAELERLERQGHLGIGQVRVARPFGNGGVATAWNQILLSFPEAPFALIANNDVRFAPGVLAAALERIDGERPQFLPLLPAERAFSAFLITALAWDAVGLFDERFHPAYLEDLDYRQRLLACPAVERLEGSFAHAAMAACNPVQSATIASDPALAEQNRRSFQLNRLWYLHRRRGPGSRGIIEGQWRQRWLGRWS